MDADMVSDGPDQPSEPFGISDRSELNAHMTLLYHRYTTTNDKRYLATMAEIVDELVIGDEAPATNHGIRSFLNFDAAMSDEDCMKLNDEFKKVYSSMAPFNKDTVKRVHDILRDPVDPQPVNAKRAVHVGDDLDDAAVGFFLDACHNVVKPDANRDTVKDQVKLILACCKAHLRRRAPSASWELSTVENQPSEPTYLGVLTVILEQLEQMEGRLKKALNELSAKHGNFRDFKSFQDLMEQSGRSTEVVFVWSLWEALFDSRKSHKLFIRTIRDIILSAENDTAQ